MPPRKVSSAHCEAIGARPALYAQCAGVPQGHQVGQPDLLGVSGHSQNN